jgi:predicted nucleotidyltransferase
VAAVVAGSAAVEAAEGSVALVVEVQAAAAPAEAGSPKVEESRGTMVAEKQITEFLSRMRHAAEDNLHSVILYGSAADGEFHPAFSNVNLLCVLRETSFAALKALTPAVEWWTRQKHHVPLLLTREELERSADVFSIELLDMQQRHRVLYGEDVLQGLTIPLRFHRVQLEYELREKTILLRERLLLASGNKDRLWEVLLGSFSTFSTLFWHALIAMGDSTPKSKREGIQALAARIQLDPSAFLQLLDIRERKADRKQLDVSDVASRYLTAVQQVTAAVDKMLDVGQ